MSKSTTSSQTPWLILGDGVRVAEHIGISDTDEEFGFYIGVRPVNGRMQAVDVSIFQKNGGPPVTRSALIDFPLTALVASALRDNVQIMVGDGEWKYGVDAAGVSAAVAADAGDTEQGLRSLARLYVFFYAIGDKPGQRISELTGMSRATVTRRLAAATEQGLLDPERRGRENRPGEGGRDAASVAKLAEAYAAASTQDLRPVPGISLEDAQARVARLQSDQ